MHLPWREMPVPGEPGPPVLTSLTAAEGAELARLAARKDVLEIGSAYGFSAISMAVGGARLITSVDPHTWCSPPTLPALRANLTAYGAEEMTLIVDDTFFKAAKPLHDRGEEFDLIFIDGDHSYETVKFDISNALPLLKRPGVIACHDYGETCCCPDVKRALDEAIPAGPSRVVDTMAVYEFPEAL